MTSPRLLQAARSTALANLFGLAGLMGICTALSAVPACAQSGQSQSAGPQPTATVKAPGAADASAALPEQTLPKRPGSTHDLTIGAKGKTSLHRPSALLPAQGTPTLSDALSQVYLTSPSLLEERAKLRATDENVPAALSGWRPSISYSVAPGFASTSLTNPSAGNGFALPTDVTSEEARYTYQTSVTATQSLYRGGRTVAATAQAENQVRAERARLLAQEEQVFSDTVNAFVGVIQDQQLYELNVNNVQVLAKQLEATNARFSVGEITRTDVAQAQAALAGAVAQRETAFGTLQTARATYRRVVGELPDKLVEPQPLDVKLANVDEAATLASVNNAAVVAAEMDNAAARDAVDAAYANLMPQIGLTSTASFSNQTSFRDQRSRGVTIGGQLTVPIYQGGSEYAAIRQAKQTEQENRKIVDDTRRSSVQQATQFWEQLVATRATVASTRAQIRADEIALDGVEREALAGTQTTLDVLNAEQALLGARVTLVQNLATLVNASYSLAASVGRLTARDLALDVPLYDEKAYYNAVRDLPFGTGDHATNQPGR